MPDPLQIEQLISLFYRCIIEEGGKTKHQPSGKQIRFWLETYGYALRSKGSCA